MITPPPAALQPRRKGRGLELAARMRLVALRLDAGLRETPQRYGPLARWAVRQGQCCEPLARFLVAEAVASLAVEPAGHPNLPNLLRQSAAWLAAAPDAMSAEVLLLLVLMDAPMVRHRRSIHCHGWRTADRRLLLLRALLVAHHRRPDAWGQAFYLEQAIAYAIADYDRDHFEMIGPGPAARAHRLADWVAAHAGRGFSGVPASL